VRRAPRACTSLHIFGLSLVLQEGVQKGGEGETGKEGRGANKARDGEEKLVHEDDLARPRPAPAPPPKRAALTFVPMMMACFSLHPPSIDILRAEEAFYAGMKRLGRHKPLCVTDQIKSDQSRWSAMEAFRKFYDQFD
jgi:hypothetical protein